MGRARSNIEGLAICPCGSTSWVRGGGCWGCRGGARTDDQTLLDERWEGVIPAEPFFWVTGYKPPPPSKGNLLRVTEPKRSPHQEQQAPIAYNPPELSRLVSGRPLELSPDFPWYPHQEDSENTHWPARYWRISRLRDRLNVYGELARSNAGLFPCAHCPDPNGIPIGCDRCRDYMARDLTRGAGRSRVTDFREMGYDSRYASERDGKVTYYSRELDPERFADTQLLRGKLSEGGGWHIDWTGPTGNPPGRPRAVWSGGSLRWEWSIRRSVLEERMESMSNGYTLDELRATLKRSSKGHSSAKDALAWSVAYLYRNTIACPDCAPSCQKYEHNYGQCRCYRHRPWARRARHSTGLLAHVLGSSHSPTKPISRSTITTLRERGRALIEQKTPLRGEGSAVRPGALRGAFPALARRMGRPTPL